MAAPPPQGQVWSIWAALSLPSQSTSRAPGFGRGQFFVSAQSLHGRGINDSRIGAMQALSNLDSPRFAKFIETWYSDSYRNGKITVKAGRQYADADFGVVEIGADFLNSSFGLNPTTPMPTFPLPEFGASVWVAPTSWMAWGVGVFNGGEMEAPSGAAAPLKKSPFTIIEAKLQPAGNQSPWRGTYRVGVWRQARSAWLPNSDTTDKPVHKRRGSTPPLIIGSRGRLTAAALEVFFQWGWAPADRNEVAGYAGAGVAYRGPLSRRPADTFGLGLCRASLAGLKSETAIEVFYGIQLTDKLRVQPDLQWIRHPASQVRNAFAVGLRLRLDF